MRYAGLGRAAVTTAEVLQRATEALVGRPGAAPAEPPGAPGSSGCGYRGVGAGAGAGAAPGPEGVRARPSPACPDEASATTSVREVSNSRGALPGLLGPSWGGPAERGAGLL